MKHLKALIAACVAIPTQIHACPAQIIPIQSYNYIPPVPPTYYPAPTFIPAQPIPLVPIPSFHPPPMLPMGPTPTQPYYQPPYGSQENDDD